MKAIREAKIRKPRKTSNDARERIWSIYSTGRAMRHSREYACSARKRKRTQ